MNAAKPAVTPMMAQYLEIKAAHPDALLFYRMGDFYEMFFDDAVAAAEALDIALTKRGKHEGDEIPMCGVPHHAAEGYFLTLIRKGFRVAVCEQMETPAEAKKRGYKAVVRREVVRLVTPGTLTEDSLLDARRHNFLAAFAEVRDDCALGWADISTGALHVMVLPRVKLGAELARLAPSELLIAEGSEANLGEIVSDMGVPLTPISRGAFDSTSAEKRVAALFGAQGLDGFGNFSRPEIGALGAIVDYLELTQKGKLPLLRPPLKETLGGAMQIDLATRRNLELTQALTGGRAGSLLATVDRTVTSGGARLLERRISSPSLSIDVIQNRLSSVSYFVNSRSAAQDLQSALKQVPDLDRALSRLSLDRGGPRDLAAVRNGLIQASVIADMALSDLPSLLAEATSNLRGHDTLIDLLDQALIADPPLLARDGGFIAPGFNADLDEARKLRDEGRSVIAGMQAAYSEQTHITSLKIKHNNVLGYFIETTAKHAETMMSPPLSETFIHRQTTANQVRFTTVELSELETKILNAGNTALEIEKRLYANLKQAVLDASAAVSAAARALAELDLQSAWAELAVSENWTLPLVDQSHAFAIEGGRHPVVEAALKKQSGAPFVANDCDLSREGGAHIWLLTGPNMAGKSTFLRQNALIALLAQAGSFVPATSAHIGIVSQLFSRVGASDDLARGRSTFMVEMVETAAILNQADDRALVILDEIGRGTATYDGLSIAWATLEHLHDVNKSRALFATHYHEMTALAAKLGGVENATVSVKEWEGEIIFLHDVKQGQADRSYGVQVAQLAGLPPAVIHRAREVLDRLEKDDRDGGGAGQLVDELPLFAATVPTTPKAADTPDLLRDRVQTLTPDTLSPREALDLIYELKALSEQG